jgi:hypothetical protein
MRGSATYSVRHHNEDDMSATFSHNAVIDSRSFKTHLLMHDCVICVVFILSLPFATCNTIHTCRWFAIFSTSQASIAPPPPTLRITAVHLRYCCLPGQNLLLLPVHTRQQNSTSLDSSCDMQCTKLHKCSVPTPPCPLTANNRCPTDADNAHNVPLYTLLMQPVSLLPQGIGFFFFTFLITALYLLAA